MDEHRGDAELNPLIDIGTLGLHAVHNSFKHGENESNWNIKKLLNSMFKLFDESPSCKLFDESPSSIIIVEIQKTWLRETQGKQKFWIFTFSDEWSTLACQASFLERNCKEAQQFSCYFPNKFPSGAFYCWFSGKSNS